MRYLISFSGLLGLIGCTDNSTPLNFTYHHSSGQPNNIKNSQHTDPNYKYEYRTGSSGDYEYNYDVSGYDENGNPVEGNIDVSKHGGSGYIQDKDGNEKSIDVEWTGKGELEGTDKDGNSVELEVDNN